MTQHITPIKKSHLGQTYTYLESHDSPSEDEWVDLFGELFGAAEGDEIFFLVESLHAEANITIVGLNKIIAIAKANGLKRSNNVMITRDSGYPIKLQMFREVAKTQDFELNMEMFNRIEDGEAWLCRQIEQRQAKDKASATG